MEERKGAQVMLAALTVMLCLSIGASGVFRLREANCGGDGDAARRKWPT
ncbi:MAG: hypothetical protein ACLUMK_03680 [Christensenellales bacterium]